MSCSLPRVASGSCGRVIPRSASTHSAQRTSSSVARPSFPLETLASLSSSYSYSSWNSNVYSKHVNNDFMKSCFSAISMDGINMNSVEQQQAQQTDTDKNDTLTADDLTSLSSNQYEITNETYNPIQTQQNILKASQWNQGSGEGGKWNPKFCHEAVSAYTLHLQYLLQLKQNPSSSNVDTSEILTQASKTLLSSHTTERAIKALVKMNLDTHHLSKSIRHLEKLIGQLSLTKLTNRLSLRLLEANGKAGNIGRTIALLNLRKAKSYKPLKKEYQYAIQSIVSAGLYLRKNRNVFLAEGQQPEIDNPTRWLDAILVNMHERNVKLSTDVANQMLDCYCSTGRSGKALHFFYKVTKDTEFEKDTLPKEVLDQMPEVDNRKYKVRMRMKAHMPPYYKIPSDVKLKGSMVRRPNRDGLIPKLEWEKENNFSLSLTAAFAFADSLTHGACGHDPIQLNRKSWNILIKACCWKGAIWRALEILQTTMPNNGIQPDTYSYNTILSGLARLGDRDFMKEMLTTMTNNDIALDKYTVQALADGYLNSGDISGAISVVQDMFNQHHILPPYTTHLKIIEFALGNDMVYEAKRHVYFIQQLWKYSPRPNDSEQFQKVIFLTQKNPKLSETSLKRLFAYFGEELTDADFF